MLAKTASDLQVSCSSAIAKKNVVVAAAVVVANEVGTDAVCGRITQLCSFAGCQCLTMAYAH